MSTHAIAAAHCCCGGVVLTCGQQVIHRCPDIVTLSFDFQFRLASICADGFCTMFDARIQVDAEMQKDGFVYECNGTYTSSSEWTNAFCCEGLDSNNNCAPFGDISGEPDLNCPAAASIGCATIDGIEYWIASFSTTLHTYNPCNASLQAYRACGRRAVSAGCSVTGSYDTTIILDDPTPNCLSNDYSQPIDRADSSTFEFVSGSLVVS